MGFANLLVIPGSEGGKPPTGSTVRLSPRIGFRRGANGNEMW